MRDDAGTRGYARGVIPFCQLPGYCNLCYGLDPKYVEPVIIAQKVSAAVVVVVVVVVVLVVVAVRLLFLVLFLFLPHHSIRRSPTPVHPPSIRPPSLRETYSK